MKDENNLIMLDLDDCSNKLRTYYKFDNTIILINNKFTLSRHFVWNRILCL